MMVAGSLLNILPLVALVSTSSLYSSYNFDPLHHLAGIAPYFEPQQPAVSPDAPQGCSVKKAAYLVRHAAIYANDFDNEEYIEPFIEKLANKSNIDWSKIPSLNFLAKWQPPFSDAEVSLLTRVGRLEATQLGVDLTFRYPNLSIPEQIWASSTKRTLKSAQSLARGLESDDRTIDVVNIYESKESGANTLAPHKSCPGYSASAGSDEADVYKKLYSKPIVARLNHLVADFNFTVSDVFGMQQLCGYESVIRGKSPFCDLALFSPDDWLNWEYAEDIRYHYNVGYGNEVAGYVGFPWLNATSNLLLKNDNKSSGGDDLVVSLTHREMPPMVLVAMGLFNNSDFSGSNNINGTMPLNHINHRRAWKSSHVLPFLTNIAIERFECTGSYGYDDGEYYRVLVNSAPQTLPTCNDGPGTSCSRKEFEAYTQTRGELFSGFSEKCNTNYKNSTDVLSIYDNHAPGNMTRR